MITLKDILAAINADPELSDLNNFTFGEHNGIIWFSDVDAGGPGTLWTDGTVIKSAKTLHGDETIADFEANPDNLEIYASIDEAIERFRAIWIDGLETY